MKCIVLADNFRKALSITERNIGKDATLPILGSILLAAERGTIRLTATNLEIGITTTIRGNVQEQGKIAIPAKTLTSFFSTLPKEEKVTLESLKHDLTISTQHQTTIIKGYSPDDFPPFPAPKELYRISMQKKDVIRALEQCLVSVAKSSIKPELASIFFFIERERLTVASTDSFRLFEETIKPVSFSLKIAKESFLLPLRTSEELIRILDSNEEGEVVFSVGKGEILITYGDITFYSRLTEGKFPDYQQIIPKKFTTDVVVKKEDIQGHIKRASIFSNKLQGVLISVIPKTGTIGVESSNSAVGEYKADCKAAIHGDDMSIVFNYTYLLDGIELYNDAELFLGFNGESQPLLIRSPKKESAFYVVMPMKGGI